MASVTDVSPATANFPVSLQHSVSGIAMSLALAADGQRLYAGTYAGVWRSDDGGRQWFALRRPQPLDDSPTVPGGLLVPDVFSVAVSPGDRDLVLASASGDTRRAPLNGIYRSTDAGVTWGLVKQFAGGQRAGQVVFAPDDPSLVFVAGGGAVAVSSDAGASWLDHPLPGGLAWHVAVAPRDAGGGRRVYAAGDGQVWVSPDSGATWVRDGSSLPQTNPAAGGLADDALGNSSAVIAVMPGDPDRVYLAVPGLANGPSFYHPKDANGNPPDGVLCNTVPARPCGEGSLWLGDYSRFPATRAATWTKLPGPPAYYWGSTPSGNVYVLAIQTPAGHLVFFSDMSHVHVCPGVPSASTSWHRLDGRDVSQGFREGQAFNQLHVHVDPHAIAVTADFDIRLQPAQGVPAPYNANSELSQYVSGTIWMGNDGGVYSSGDGGQTWTLGAGLSTLKSINVAGLSIPGQPPALYLGTGDNDDFFTTTGGQQWDDPALWTGDSAAFYTDPGQPTRAVFLALRVPLQPGMWGSYALYDSASDGYPDASATAIAAGRTRLTIIPKPAGDGDGFAWDEDEQGRPLIVSPAGQTPPPDGDFVLLQTPSGRPRRLLRTTTISAIGAPGDWDDPGKAVQQGPDLPAGMSVVQASGGHATPVFFVADPYAGATLWKWTAGMGSWLRIVPSAAGTATAATRVFTDPYRPELIYILDRDAVKRSDGGGATWAVDAPLTAAITENGAFTLPGGPRPALQAMTFSRGEPQTRFALGPAGVFVTLDGQTWRRLLSTSAWPGRPLSGFFDESRRSLYVAMWFGGIIRIDAIPAPFTAEDLTAQTGRQISGPLTTWREAQSGLEWLAGVSPTDHLVTFAWSPNTGWVAFDLTTEPDRALSGPLTSWSHGPVTISDLVAGTTPEGDLLLFEGFPTSHTYAWSNYQVVDLSAIQPRVGFFAAPTSWQSPFGTEYLAAMSTDGNVIILPVAANERISLQDLTGRRIRGELTAWQVPGGQGVVVEHLAGIEAATGHLLVFYSLASQTTGAWQPSPIGVVDVTAKAGGAQPASPLTAWQTQDGPFLVEHLAGTDANGNVLVFWWSPRQDWQVVDVTAKTGKRVSSPLTSWQTRTGGQVAEHLAGISQAGHLVEFRWMPSTDWTAVDITAGGGPSLLDAGRVTSWQSTEGPYIVERLAAITPGFHAIVLSRRVVPN
jgi:photosystem II stability/assembly factor-like uncharacterized protein